MPGFSSLPAQTQAAVVQYVLSGEGNAISTAAPSPTELPYSFTGYHNWLDPDGYPAVAPPWGTLNAIDLNTGEYRWKSRSESIRRSPRRGSRTPARRTTAVRSLLRVGSVHRRDQFRQEVSRVRQGHRQAPLGNHNGQRRQHDTHYL